MLLEDEHGDDVEVVFLESQEGPLVEMSVLSGDYTTLHKVGERNERKDGKKTGNMVDVIEGKYLGGFVLNEENATRLVHALVRWLNKEEQDE